MPAQSNLDILSLQNDIPPAILAQILVIEELSFPHPWDASVFLDELRQPSGIVDVLCRRRRAGPVVLGFCCCRVLYDELHILQIATHPDLRRQGHGAALIAQALCQAQRRGCQALVLEVRRSNRAAINLYQKHGFAQIGIRPAYYADNREDAVVMSCAI